ncbi:unnamed protein product [Lepeophtheirus salmonis]|uniref:(salmon louse) hypothetical protein n=1 Tax=Lepeophtheirus salmonis TaxID=72036 RepID=A0A7R8H1V2_LEPSM|nr:unnamed protein product [Lepeophtheirus salmonis]CAF2801642.1 unnamed protein product [Lepeophtheirus salmonis]
MYSHRLIYDKIFWSSSSQAVHQREPNQIRVQSVVHMCPRGEILHGRKYTKVRNWAFGQSPDVVLEVVRQMELQTGHNIVRDYLFTSLDLSDNLITKDNGVLGTLR